MERTLDKKQIIAALVQSPHGKLTDYLSVGTTAADQDAEFFAHLVAWNHVKGQVRDSKVALPIIALKTLPTNGGLREEWRARFTDNALAHLADLRPREFKAAVEFGWDIGAPTRLLKRLTIRYLRDLEADRGDWERTALQHRGTLRWLYAQAQIPVRVMGERSDYLNTKSGESALFGQLRDVRQSPYGSRDRGLAPERFRVLKTLHTLSPIEIAAMIGKFKLPFLIARGAAGAKASDPDVVLALMAQMTPPQLATNMKWLEKRGVKTVPALRAALEAALGKAATSKAAPRSTLKTTRAAQALADDVVLSGKLRVLQEKQLEKVETVDGDWLILADKSGSMEQAMAAARLIAGTLARLVQGRVHLVFFDTTPRYYEVTGKSLEEIEALTGGMQAQGGTLIGCGLQELGDRGIRVDGIAIVSDGCENDGGYITSGNPMHFGPAYLTYLRRMQLADKPPTVYWYRTSVTVLALAVEAVMQDYHVTKAKAIQLLWESAKREVDGFQSRVRQASIDLQLFDLSQGTVDYHSVLNLVPTMKVRRFQLLDQILATPLRTLNEALERTHGMPVLPQGQLVHV